jgi:hypothetical protein
MTRTNQLRPSKDESTYILSSRGNPIVPNFLRPEDVAAWNFLIRMYLKSIIVTPNAPILLYRLTHRRDHSQLERTGLNNTTICQPPFDT